MTENITDIRPGDIILWKGGGWFTDILSGILALKDKSWRVRTWRPWHTGFVVKQLDTGEIVTFQAVNLFTGVCAVTYETKLDMGDCKIYHWLNNPDPARLEQYVLQCNGWPYDVWAYFFVVITVLFNQHWAISDKKLMCWENTSNFCRFMGKELQPCYEEPLISKMINALESKT